MHFPHADVCGGGLLGLLWLGFTIFALIHILCSSASAGWKAIWVVLIFAFPCVGPVLWFMLGPRQRG